MCYKFISKWKKKGMKLRNIDKLLLQEIQTEAEQAKDVIKKEIECSVEELSKISIVDFTPTCPLPSINTYIEECLLEFTRRCNIVETNLKNRLESLVPEINFFQYDIVKTILERMIYDSIPDDGPWFYHPMIETRDIQAKVKTKLSSPLLRYGISLFPHITLNYIKKICDNVFQAEIKSKSDDIVSFCTQKITRQIDGILDYIKSEIS